MTLNKIFLPGEKGRTLGINFQTYSLFNHTGFNTIGTTYTFSRASLVNTNTTTGQCTAAQPNGQVVVTAKFTF